MHDVIWIGRPGAGDKAAMLLGTTVDKVLERKEFGQDLLGTEECSSKDVSEFILA